MNDVASASNNSLAPGMVKRQRDTFQTQGDTVCTDQKLGDAARHSPPLTQSCSRADAQTIMICCRGVHARNNECDRRKVQSCWRPVPSPVPQQSCKENSPTRHDKNSQAQQRMYRVSWVHTCLLSGTKMARVVVMRLITCEDSVRLAIVLHLHARKVKQRTGC